MIGKGPSEHKNNLIQFYVLQKANERSKTIIALRNERVTLHSATFLSRTSKLYFFLKRMHQKSSSSFEATFDSNKQLQYQCNLKMKNVKLALMLHVCHTNVCVCLNLITKKCESFVVPLIEFKIS